MILILAESICSHMQKVRQPNAGSLSGPPTLEWPPQSDARTLGMGGMGGMEARKEAEVQEMLHRQGTAGAEKGAVGCLRALPSRGIPFWKATYFFVRSVCVCVFRFSGMLVVFTCPLSRSAGAEPTIFWPRCFMRTTCHVSGRRKEVGLKAMSAQGSIL